MAASFPTSVKSFTTKVDGAGGDLVAAADVNGLQDEVVAIETELKKTTGSVVDHGGLAGLADNDHPQYSLTTHDHDADYSDIAHTHDALLTGWVPISDTWTYASAKRISVPAGAQSTYPTYFKLRWKQGGAYKYAYAWVETDTVVYIFAGSDYSVANAAITDVAYSIFDLPLGFPVRFNFNPSIFAYYGSGNVIPTYTDTFISTFSMSNGLFHVSIDWLNVAGGTAGSGTGTLAFYLPSSYLGKAYKPVFGPVSITNFDVTYSTPYVAAGINDNACVFTFNNNFIDMPGGVVLSMQSNQYRSISSQFTYLHMGYEAA